MIARRLVVRGRVQGVGFRYALTDAAGALHVSGWVRNRSDGTVEAFVQGDEAAVDAIATWCWHGPPAAQVTAVDTVPAAPDSTLSEFGHRPTA
jgi:acylphosphatase